MKTHQIIFMALLVLWSCNNSSTKDKNTLPLSEIAIKKDSIENKLALTGEKKEPVNKIDIQLIKECSEQGISSFYMDSITESKKYLDNSLIENVIGKIPVNEQKDWFLKTNEWERFSCFQWEENENYFLFTLLQQDESCCLTMYLCVSDKIGNLLTVRQLGLSGGDGGWYENDWGEKLGFGNFKLYYNSYYDEGKYENEVHLGYTREHIYTELQVSLEGKGFRIDTLNYIKTDTLILKELQNKNLAEVKTKFIKSDSGLKYKVIKEGIGEVAEIGDKVMIFETTSYRNGTELYSNENSTNPIKVILGADMVTKGVEEGLRGMRSGEIRELIVPHYLAKRKFYPDNVSPDSILVIKLIVDKIIKAN